ncbi:hypothetical protein GJAV_G00027790 [Gymnothorax javanicus]|nr:hypothetical protein GJAV_G00027790 [Gymnothorax javanicus]
MLLHTSAACSPKQHMSSSCWLLSSVVTQQVHYQKRQGFVCPAPHKEQLGVQGHLQDFSKRAGVSSNKETKISEEEKARRQAVTPIRDAC